MKISTALASVLSVATFASAAPSAPTLPFPPKSEQAHGMTIEQIAAIPKPPAQPVSVMTTEANGGTVSIMAGCRRNIHMRWGTMSAQQRTNYVNAIKCLMGRPRRGIWNGARSLYDEMVYVHNQMVNQIHGSDIFLPWHRYYLYMLRSFMSTECGFNGPYAWWKETNNVGNFGASDIFSAQWFGALPQASGNNGFCITNGVFANLINPISGQCVARGERRDMSANDNIGNEDYVNGRTTYSDMRAYLEGLNHAYGHLAIGPTMSSQAQSPADPVFFLHHSYVDWTWKRWQNQASWRWSSISGCADKNSPCTPLTVNTQLTSMGLFRAMTVGELLDTEGDVGCYTYDNLV
ncbi:uncharacterized protein B0I36DRAFT_326341 [Microdochium trichocladiopsis]|uniref:Tyrosinase copper-binding domain-containing protein n=1 Tax=Microdochium trichocladiopsis TaxID=1682393 RepID=A0A9P9BMM6_9PEZI|nr:uncharacterized protein B0I36DRAFT_326341 [Microdochium trichocladiopsis]KAH7029768.1 hypothetical protein B0I36DRAFT_326341 [Microdochium trichocladiopsis]